MARRLVIYGALAAIIGAAYAPSLRYGFVGDDFHHARPLRVSELLSTFYGDWEPKQPGQSFGASYYRPVVAVAFVADHALWGARAFGYHLTNLVLLWANGVAAFHLLRRIGAAAGAAAAGAGLWLIHPLSAVTAAWCSERTDSIAAVFFLLALLALMRPSWRGPKDSCLVLTFTALALASKEMSVTLPAVGAMFLSFLRPPARRARWLTVGMVLGLVGIYLVAWQAMFPEKRLVRLAGLERLLGLMVPVFRPTSYTLWSQLTAVPWGSGLGLAAALGAGAFIVGRLTRRAEPPRLYAIGIGWVALTVVPTAGLPNPDIFRLGFLVAFGFSLLVAAMATALERYREILVVGAVVLAVWMTPLATKSAAFWGPGGWWYETYVTLKSKDEAWVRSLTPEMQSRLRRQLEAHVDAPKAPQPLVN